jgi:hypothetical protein
MSIFLGFHHKPVHELPHKQRSLKELEETLLNEEIKNTEAIKRARAIVTSESYRKIFDSTIEELEKAIGIIKNNDPNSRNANIKDKKL